MVLSAQSVSLKKRTLNSISAPKHVSKFSFMWCNIYFCMSLGFCKINSWKLPGNLCSVCIYIRLSCSSFKSNGKIAFFRGTLPCVCVCVCVCGCGCVEKTQIKLFAFLTLALVLNGWPVSCFGHSDPCKAAPGTTWLKTVWRKSPAYRDLNPGL